jgi:hypothetical protein
VEDFLVDDLSKVRGRDYCRSCSSTDIFSGLNLGLLPIANELSKVKCV